MFWDDQLVKRADEAARPVAELAAKHGCLGGFSRAIYVQVGRGNRHIAWTVEVNGKTRLGADFEGATPKEAAEALRKLANALDDPELGPTCAEAIAKVPKADGSARAYPPNFWE